MRTPLWVPAALGLAALGLIVLPTPSGAQTAAADAADAAPPQRQEAGREADGKQQAAVAGQGRFLTPQDFSDLAQAKLPAVVSIISTRDPNQDPNQDSGRDWGEPPRQGRPMPPGMEDFLRRFGIPTPEDGPGGGRPRGPVSALGSGFIIDRDGHVVTNNHVVERADTVEVVLEQGRKLAATIVGTDPRTDLALLKVDSDQPLPHLDWGSSDDAQVGNWVMAIGNPFGLGGTVTTGVISARARDIGSGPYDDYLQTDAAINRGNSGGPLIDMRGRVIGVNAAIYSPTGGSVGIGFAVPSAIAQEVITQLRETGKVERGWLGVQIQRVTEDIASSLGLPTAGGALVGDVTPDSPAAAAGVRVGDVILRFGGAGIEDLRDLTLAVARTPAGQQADMTVWRDGKEVVLTPRIALLSEAGSGGEDPAGSSPEPGSLGLTLAPLTPETRARFAIAEDVEGALVADVAEGSPAFEHGLIPGDVILRVGDAEVSDPADVAAAVAKARESERDSVLVLRQRENSKTFLALPLDEQPG